MIKSYFQKIYSKNIFKKYALIKQLKVKLFEILKKDKFLNIFDKFKFLKNNFLFIFKKLTKYFFSI
jgi:hypothetical protein